MNYNELAIEGYSLYRVDSSNRHTGGVACYVSHSVKIQIMQTYDKNNIWALSFKILSGFVRDAFCVVYRGHKSNLHNFTEFLTEICEVLCTECNYFHIIGDVNFDYLNKSNLTSLIDTFKSFGIRQAVTSPTRQYKNSSTIIDWVLTNKKNLVPAINCELNIADHNLIYLNFFDNKENESSEICRIYTDWSNYSRQGLHEYFSQINWFDFDSSSSANDMFEILHNYLSLYIQSSVSIKTVCQSPSIRWFNRELGELKNRKIEAKIIWNNDKNDENWKSYTQIRNQYKNKLRKAERDYIHDQLYTNKDDPKKLWKTLKSIYGQNNSSHLDYVKFGDVIETDSSVIATKLNEYFIKSIVDISSNIQDVNANLIFNVNSTNATFSFTEVAHDTVLLYINDMKSKYYVDNITGKVLTDAIDSPQFLISLTKFINKSFFSGIFPDKCKLSTIAPIQKIKGSHNASDLRPINTLSVLSHLIERIVKDQIVEFFDENNLFCSMQSGFRKHHSCETALSYVITDWKDALDKNLIVISVFLDLKRAFETVDRRLLLKKLELYGCSDSVIKWFASYLTNRFQRTKFDDKFSEFLPTHIGIPQGSTLSCFLFLIFINDLYNVLEHTHLKLFADDALIYLKCKPAEIDEAIKLLNSDLERVYSWLCYSKLSLNISKTKAMIISYNKSLVRNSEIMINIQAVEIVSEYKYLGIIFDTKLCFSSHADYILSKLNKKFYVLKRCANKMNEESKKLFVNSLVMPHLNYCSTILFLLNDGQVNEIQKVMNRFMRLILRADFRTPRMEMIEAIGWMTVKQQIYYNVICFIHRLTLGDAPNYLYRNLLKVKDTHKHQTRQTDDYLLRNYTKATSQNSLFYKGIQLYNDFMRFTRSDSGDQKRSYRILAKAYVKSSVLLV
jgi:hypothetical protein